MKMTTTALLLASILASTGAVASDWAGECDPCKPMQAGDSLTTQIAIDIANSGVKVAAGDLIDVYNIRNAPNGTEVYRMRHFLVARVPVISTLDLEDQGSEINFHDLAVVPGPYGNYSWDFLMGISPTVTVHPIQNP